MAETITNPYKASFKVRAMQLGFLVTALSFPSQFKSAVAHGAEAVVYTGSALIDLASSSDTAPEEAVMTLLVEAQPEVQVAGATPSTPIDINNAPAAEVIPTTTAEWLLNPDYVSIIESLDIADYKKQYVLLAVQNTWAVLEQGAQVNPSVMVAQTVIETGYGQDTLSGPAHNYFGVKANNNDVAIEVSTTEDYGNGLVRETHGFRVYNNPLESFMDYARMIQELPWYEDAQACRFNAESYALGLQNNLDPQTCAIVQQKGEPGVKSYATAQNYVSVINDVVDSLRLREIFGPRA